MMVAFLLLGLFIGAVTAAVTVAMLRGVWLKVEISQTHRVRHDHYVYADPGDAMPTARVIETRVLPHAVLPRQTARPVVYQLPPNTVKEIQ